MSILKMKKNKYILWFLGTIFLSLFMLVKIFAAGKEKTGFDTTLYASGFIENKGQMIDQNNKPNPAPLYLLWFIHQAERMLFRSDV